VVAGGVCAAIQATDTQTNADKTSIADTNGLAGLADVEREL
jgi:hypothetical protein